MSNLRARAQEIKEAAAEERGNYEPPAVPRRIYDYWTKHSLAEVPERENFCHFWRVVAIWAPLTFVRVQLVRIGSSNTGLGVLVGLYVTTFVLLAFTDAWAATVAGLGAPYVIAGVLAGAYRVAENDFDRIETALFYFTLPVSGPLFLVGKAIKNFPKRWEEKLKTAMLVFAVAVFVVLVVAWLYVLFVEYGWLGIGLLLAGIAGAAALIVGLVYLTNFIAGRRAIKRKAESEALFDAIERGERVSFTKPPGRLSRFFSGLADMLIFVAQVVRVKKWKICPIVRIERETDEVPSYNQ